MLLICRYDPKAVGAAKTVQFLSQLGLDDSGKSKKTSGLLHPSYKADHSPMTSARSERGNKTSSTEHDCPSPKLKSSWKVKKCVNNSQTPRLEVITDCLNCKVGSIKWRVVVDLCCWFLFVFVCTGKDKQYCITF